MEPTSSKRVVIVVSDSPKLQRALTLNLRDHWNVLSASPDVTEQALTAPVHVLPDLIIVALSLDESEAVVTLAQASLSDYIGRVPLLIISDRPFAADTTRRIGHLSFPFSPSALDESILGLQNEADIEKGKQHE